MAQENIVLPIEKYHRMVEQINKTHEHEKKKASNSDHEDKHSRDTGELHAAAPKTEPQDPHNSHEQHTSHEQHDSTQTIVPEHATPSHDDMRTAAMPPGLNADEVLVRSQAKRKPRPPTRAVSRKETKRPRTDSDPANTARSQRKSTDNKKQKKRNRLYESWIILNKKK
jgi:hypothetical protein